MATKPQSATTSATLINRVANWLVAEALLEPDVTALVTGTCERLHAAGIALVRGYAAFPVLHPLHSAVGITWLRGQDTALDGYPHVPGGVSSGFEQSPHYYMLERGLDFLRVKLDCPTRSYQFAVFDDLRAEHVTDYLAYVVSFEPPATRRAGRGAGRRQLNGMIGSWATDRVSGFTDSEVEALLRIQDRLALACKVAIKSQLMRNIAETYLGVEAGRHVLDGQIKRGDGQSIEAAIWFCDLRASTRMADTLPPEAYIANLNRYYDATGGAVQAAGGEILSFIGDGVLAIFTKNPQEVGLERACGRAAEAARMACENLAAVNAERAAGDLEPLAHGLALHVGNVMYGNVGVPERLTFSAFGAAVNEVVRLEALTKQLGEPVLTSGAFASCLGAPGRFLGEHVLRGVGAPLAVHALDRASGS